MPYAYVGYFDKETELAIANLRNRIMEDAGISDEFENKYRPHITFLVSDTLNSSTELPHLSNEIKNLKKIDITLSKLGFFNKNIFVTYLCIEKEKTLMDFFHCLHLIKNHNNEINHLKEAEFDWIPHCTLSNRITNITYNSITDRNSLLIKGRLNSLGIIEFPNDRNIFEERLS